MDQIAPFILKHHDATRTLGLDVDKKSLMEEKMRWNCEINKLSFYFQLLH